MGPLHGSTQHPRVRVAPRFPQLVSQKLRVNFRLPSVLLQRLDHSRSYVGFAEASTGRIEHLLSRDISRTAAKRPLRRCPLLTLSNSARDGRRQRTWQLSLTILHADTLTRRAVCSMEDSALPRLLTVITAGSSRKR